jgi:adenylate cyclase
MNGGETETRALSSVDLLDAAVWREIGSEEPQPPAAFVEALATLFGRWLLVRSNTPQMDLMAVMCRARGYIERGGPAHSGGIAWRR